MSPFKICTFKELAISKEFFCGDAVHIQVPERVPGKRVYGWVCMCMIQLKTKGKNT